MKIFIIKQRNIIVSVVVVCLVILGVFGYKNFIRAETTFWSPLMGVKIAIDPGHGGFDPGASSPSGVTEDKINLQICLKIRELLEQSGANVLMTRETDKGLDTAKSTTIRQRKNEDLRNRRIKINNNKPDVLVSIHLNSFSQASSHGAQVFYKNKCNRSKDIADIVQLNLKNFLDKNNKRLPQSRDSIYLLKKAICPSILIECGFLSNPKEEKLLQTDEYQQKIALAVYMGLLDFFEKDKYGR